jgi:hypothetical protein
MQQCVWFRESMRALKSYVIFQGPGIGTNFQAAKFEYCYTATIESRISSRRMRASTYLECFTVHST